jgi:formate hydrogenlyase subunit 6/NADH:ubiquinone oxidoreductase subunit I
MGVDPLDIPTTKEAASRGAGVAELKDIEILGESLESVTGTPFKMPKTALTRRIPGPVKELAKKLIRYYPCVERDNCVRCAACIDACPNKAISMAKKGIVFDYSRCIACFCCSEACPASAIKVKKSLFAKIIGL